MMTRPNACQPAHKDDNEAQTTEAGGARAHQEHDVDDHHRVAGRLLAVINSRHRGVELHEARDRENRRKLQSSGSHQALQLSMR